MSLDFASYLDAMDDNPFEEIPVDVETFVRSRDYLGQPELSDIQYTLVETMSQIYRMDDLITIMGDRKGREHHAKYTKSEIILQCGKGSGKDFTSTVGVAYMVYKLLFLCFNFNEGKHYVDRAIITRYYAHRQVLEQLDLVDFIF